MVVYEEREVAAILPTGYVWVGRGGMGGGGVCVAKTCYFFPKYRVLIAYQLP